MKSKLVALITLAAGSLLAEAPPADSVEIVKRSLPFIKEKGLAWIEDRQCASCHQIPSMLWSLNSAVKAGLMMESPEVAEWAPWAADWRHWNKTGDKEGMDKVSSGNIDTMVYLLLGRDEEITPAPAWTADFRAQILKNQQPDGSWKAGGQLPLGKRPPREIHEVTTMWTLLALKSYAGEEVPVDVEKRADDYLSKSQPGQSTEWHVVRQLLKPADADLREALLKSQHEDGGWGWLTKDPSDAFGTGLALYALAKTGLPMTHEAVQRAIAFLKNSQQPDGAWPVPSTRARDKNKINKTATYWGTTWAVIGLLEASRKNSEPAPE